MRKDHNEIFIACGGMSTAHVWKTHAITLRYGTCMHHDGICVEHVCNTRCMYVRNVNGTCIGYVSNMKACIQLYGICMGHDSKMRGTCAGMWNRSGTCMAYIWNMYRCMRNVYGPCMEYERNIKDFRKK